MLTMQRAFSQLRLVMNSAMVNTGWRLKGLTGEMTSRIQKPQLSASQPHTVTKVCTQWCSTSSASEKQGTKSKTKIQSYDPPSPYRNPGPRRYGYEPHFFTGGLLPRGEDLDPVRSLPKYKAKDSWNKKRALFGQNDYIDILGDGSIKPTDLIRGPDWLIGYKGNELQRLVRRLNFHGDKLKLLYPHKYHDIQKRVFFLYKKYNRRRGKRVGSQRRS